MTSDKVGVGEEGRAGLAARTPVFTMAGSSTSFVAGLLATAEPGSSKFESVTNGSSEMVLPDVFVRGAYLVLRGGGSTLGGVSASIMTSDVSAD